MDMELLATHELRYVVLTLVVLGAPLLVFVLNSTFRGRAYFARRWLLVSAYYCLLVVVEFAARFVPVALPVMVLVVCTPVLALFLLIPPRSDGAEKRRGFDVISRSGDQT